MKSCESLLLCENNAENGHFDQRLECAAPKRLSKYTTTDGHNFYQTNILSS